MTFSIFYTLCKTNSSFQLCFLSDLFSISSKALSSIKIQLNMAPKFCEILMFVWILEDAKQCCDATNLHCTHCAYQQRSSLTMQHNEYHWSLRHPSIVWRHLQTNKHQISWALGSPFRIIEENNPITKKEHQSQV